MAKLQSIKDLLNKTNFVDRIVDGKSHITEEFQDFGYRLAQKLGDLQHKALYIKLAKDLPRGLLEEVVQFSLDYPVKSGSKARVFMWRLNETCKEKGYKMPSRKPKIIKPKKKKPQLELI